MTSTDVTAMIRALVREVVFGLHLHWDHACADPVTANTASWRALEKAGFHFAGPVDTAQGPSRLMVLDRPATA